MERYLDWAREFYAMGDMHHALEKVRKATALGVAMMETYGAPPRETGGGVG